MNNVSCRRDMTEILLKAAQIYFHPLQKVKKNQVCFFFKQRTHEMPLEN